MGTLPEELMPKRRILEQKRKKTQTLNNKLVTAKLEHLVAHTKFWNAVTKRMKLEHEEHLEYDPDTKTIYAIPKQPAEPLIAFRKL